MPKASKRKAVNQQNAAAARRAKAEGLKEKTQSAVVEDLEEEDLEESEEWDGGEEEASESEDEAGTEETPIASVGEKILGEWLDEVQEEEGSQKDWKKAGSHLRTYYTGEPSMFLPAK
jgi:hypothetical protein